MKNLAAKLITLGFLILTPISLSAQGKDEGKYFRKVKMEHCLSKSGRSYSHPSKNEKVELYCLSKKSRRDNFTFYPQESPYGSYCVSSQAKRYNRQFEKMNKSRR
jgi:hypothetical protein